MAALVVLERERAAVTPPLGRPQVVRVREERGVDDELAFCFDVEEDGLIHVENIAGLLVVPGRMLRLQLVARR